MRVTILRLSARAGLDGAASDALDEAAQRASEGDVDHAWLLREREEGRLLLARLVVTLCAEAADGRREEVAVVSPGIWLEPDDIPHVEAQVSETATKDLVRLAAELHGSGFAVQAGTLDGMYIHVELEDSLRQALRSAGAPPRPW